MNDPVLQVKPTELKKWMDASADIELIDVREQHEHHEFNIGGRLVPLGEVMQQADTIPKHRKVILYCKLGIRSQIAIQRFHTELLYEYSRPPLTPYTWKEKLLPKLAAEDKTPVATYCVRLRSDVYAQLVGYGTYLNEQSSFIPIRHHLMTRPWKAELKHGKGRSNDHFVMNNGRQMRIESGNKSSSAYVKLGCNFLPSITCPRLYISS